MDGAIIEHADTVVSVVPVWAPMAVAMVISGMPEHVIRGWSDAGEIRAKKLEGDAQRARRVYRVQDILEKIDELPDCKKEIANGN
ncbi:MAG: hypothetical protein J6V72_08225 [Kiritimatiellae bacterium]|nr:hypothetical protein [Kiritimatiellia bacterium]